MRRFVGLKIRKTMPILQVVKAASVEKINPSQDSLSLPFEHNIILWYRILSDCHTPSHAIHFCLEDMKPPAERLPYIEMLARASSSAQQRKDLESFVVAIDAGGSGCKSVLMSQSGQHWSGQSGPCNILTLGIESTMATISESLQQAVDAHPTLASRSFRSVSISCVWVGMAGYGCPALRPLIRDKLMETLGFQESEMLRITSDVGLLTAAVPGCPMARSAIALLAGTGSIAMSFRREDDHSLTPVARVGGWGHVLGDDGSGYWLGRMGLRAFLASLDIMELRRTSEEDFTGFKTYEDSLVEKISAYVASYNPRLDPEAVDIIRYTATCGVKGVAALAEVILDAYTTSAVAHDIVEKGTKSLANMVKLLVTERRIECSDTVLVLSGGLMKNAIYRQLIRERLTDEGVGFLGIHVVQYPALAAAEWLRRTY